MRGLPRRAPAAGRARGVDPDRGRVLRRARDGRRLRRRAGAVRGPATRRSARWAAVVGEEWPVLFLWPLALAYVFPDGRLPSPRWRPVAVPAAVVGVGVTLLIFLAPELEGPYGRCPPRCRSSSTRAPSCPSSGPAGSGSCCRCSAAQPRCVRATGRAAPDERRQVLWLAYGALLVPLWLGGGWLLSWLIGPALRRAGRHRARDLPGLAGGGGRGRGHPPRAVLDRPAVQPDARLRAPDGAAGRHLRRRGAAWSACWPAARRCRPRSRRSPRRWPSGRCATRVQTIVDRRFARARFDAVRLMRGFLDDVRDGRAEPEDVGAVMRLALDDPTAEVAVPPARDRRLRRPPGPSAR